MTGNPSPNRLLVWTAVFVALAGVAWFGWQSLQPKPAAEAVPAAQQGPGAETAAPAAPADTASSEAAPADGQVFPVF